MATRSIAILGAATVPDTSGNVWQEPAATTLQANDRYPNMVFVFADTSTRLKLGVGFRVPENYVSAPKIGFICATTATSGKVVCEVDYTAIAAGESADPSADQETVTDTGTTVPGTARLIFIVEKSLTAGNLAAGDWVQMALVRDGADTTNDTLAAMLFLLGAYFSYSDV